MKTADKFTLSRIVLAPVFFVIFFIPAWTGWGQVISACILIPMLLFLEFTDFLDGYYARKHKEVSDFGKLFDPFADVLLHLTVFYCFVLTGYMPSFIFVLILYREFGMTFIRMLAARKGITMGARKGGKTKTVLYVTAGVYSLVVESLSRFGVEMSANMQILRAVGYALYIVALIAAYVSFADYLVYFRKLQSEEKSEKKD